MNFVWFGLGIVAGVLVLGYVLKRAAEYAVGRGLGW